MGNDNFITYEDCDGYRTEYNKELGDHNTRLMILESNFKDIKNSLNVIIGLIGSGMVSIIVILLTRGL